MIFYFSGTGNSKYLANRLCGEGERLVSIAEAMNEEMFSFDVKGETLGFVMPVYFYSVPLFVREFIRKLKFENVSYVYAIMCCGGGMGQAGNMLHKLLNEAGIELDYVKEVVMPDNSMLFYQIPGVKGADERIAKADELLNDVKKDIDQRKKMTISSSTIVADIMSFAYEHSTSTAKFYADQNCIGCGLCAKNCPEKAIEIKEGRPVWIKEKCSKCSSCINRCPKMAIQYGRGTKKRNRYVNPYENR